MKGKLFKAIFASSAQVIINQIASLVIFLITSTYLAKNIYGEFNWCIAIITVIISLLSFGMEPVIVKRVAAGADIRETTGLYIQHVLFTGLLFVMVLFVMSFVTPLFFQAHSSLILLSVSFLLTYFASPFKQLANGRQWYHYLAIMSSISNMIRAACLLLLIFITRFQLHTVLLIFVASSLCELIGSVWLMLKKTRIPLLQLTWSRKKYLSLVKEALPQLGVAFFNMSLARFDWIFLGIMTSAVITADYSFTYRVYELCSLPLLVIAPLLLPAFTRFFLDKQQTNLQEKTENLFVLLRLEIVMASFIALLLNLTWIPVIDAITHNKYGAVNARTVFILSCSMPFLYVNNFLWTINFAQGYLKLILYVIATIFVVNIVGDILLIPVWQGPGAAVAFLTAIVVQTVIFMKKTSFPGLSKIWLSLIICTGSAILSGLLAGMFFSHYWLIVPSALILFTGLLILGRQIMITDWRLLKKALGI